VELDMSAPFCAARARNAGYERVRQASYVQFIDADCHLAQGWMSAAVEFLEARPDVAAVAGRVSERAPEESIYNRLGEFEWNFAGTGDVEATGGICMVRSQPFRDVGGFDESVPAGEEPELCLRLRRRGWKIHRLGQPMATHDLGMRSLAQWWRRMVRNGYGSADVGARFALAKFRCNNWRVRAWSVWLVAFVASLLAAAPWIALSLLALWLAQLMRITLRARQAGHSGRLSLAYGFFTMLSFWPQMQGQILFTLDRARSAGMRLVEYKGPREHRS